jgi:CheY-like chemotaxis protein
MNGRLWCKNNEPCGCSFYGTVQLEESSVNDHSAGLTHVTNTNNNGSGQPTPADSKRLKVLLAEDSPINQTLMINLLSKWGHEVVVASNGFEAIKSWQTAEKRFDLILMDVLMPGCDGLEATTKIRELEQALVEHIPIIALTAQALEGDRKACLQSGMDAYTSKPISRETLQELINELT